MKSYSSLPAGAALALDALHRLRGTVETMPRLDAWASAYQLVNGRVDLGRMVPVETVEIDTLITATGSQPVVTPTLCRMGLYQIGDDGTLSLLARTASDTTIWSVAQTRYSRALDTAGGYPASVRMIAGVAYALGVIVVGSATAPGLWNTGPSATPAAGQTPIMALRSTSTAYTDLPSSIAAAGYSGTASMIWGAAA